MKEQNSKRKVLQVELEVVFDLKLKPRGMLYISQLLPDS